jgi:hypothetical protein
VLLSVFHFYYLVGFSFKFCYFQVYLCHLFLVLFFDNGCVVFTLYLRDLLVFFISLGKTCVLEFLYAVLDLYIVTSRLVERFIQHLRNYNRHNNHVFDINSKLIEF